MEVESWVTLPNRKQSRVSSRNCWPLALIVDEALASCEGEVNTVVPPDAGDGYEAITEDAARMYKDSEFQVMFGGKWDGQWDPIERCWWGAYNIYAFLRLELCYRGTVIARRDSCKG